MVIIADCFDERFAKSGQMCTVLRCELAIHESVIIFAILIAMCKGKLNIFTFEVDDRIDRILIKVFLQKIVKTILRKILLSIEIDNQPCIQEGIVFQQRNYKLLNIMVVFENLAIG